MRMRQSCLIGQYIPIHKREESKHKISHQLTGKMLLNWFLEEMMLSASTSGIKATNHPSQKHNGKRRKMKNCSALFQRKVPNSGKRLLMLSMKFLACRGTESNAEKGGTTFLILKLTETRSLPRKICRSCNSDKR